MCQPRELIRPECSQPPYFVGLDLGGTNIKVGVVDDLGRTLSWLTVPTHADRGPEDAAGRMARAVQQAIADAGLKLAEIAAVGLGSPGTMDIPGGRLLVPANLKGWEYFPIRDRVAHHLGRPVVFANDATAAAFGEFWIGSGRDFHSMVLLTLGTGIGCGIIVGNLLLDGEHSHGGEFGHTIIDCDENARICACGQPGHFEAYASATAVVKRTREALEARWTSSLTERLAAGAELTPILVAEEAEKGDELSRHVILQTGRYLAVGIVNLMHTLDPNGILIGGAMTFGGHQTEIGRLFLKRTREEIRRRAYPILAEKTIIDFAILGGDAGYLGAAGIARMACAVGQ
jgi:glucokinase